MQRQALPLRDFRTSGKLEGMWRMPEEPEQRPTKKEPKVHLNQKEANQHVITHRDRKGSKNTHNRGRVRQCLCI